MGFNSPDSWFSEHKPSIVNRSWIQIHDFPMFHTLLWKWLEWYNEMNEAYHAKNLEQLKRYSVHNIIRKPVFKIRIESEKIHWEDITDEYYASIDNKTTSINPKPEKIKRNILSKIFSILKI